jgi:hypothetical protein
MTLQQTAARALVARVRAVTRGRNFLVWFTDGPDSRAAGLEPPHVHTPPALKDILLRFSPARHQVVYSSSDAFLQQVMPGLLAAGVCLVKHAPTSTQRYTSPQEEEESMRKWRVVMLRHTALTDAEVKHRMKVAENANHARPGTRKRRR